MGSREVAKSFLDEIFTHAAARLAMLAAPFVVTILGYATIGYLDNRFDKVDSKQVAIEQKVIDVSATLSTNTANDALTHDRLVITEQTLAAARDDRDRFQKQVLDTLNQMQKDISRQAVDIGSISAFISASQGSGFGGKVQTGPNGPRGGLR